MKIKVKLPNDVVDYLSSYGDLTTIVNTILERWEYGDVMSSGIPREGDHRYTLDITSDAYWAAREMYGSTSSRCSIRGILCYIVYNEDLSILDDVEFAPDKEQLKIVEVDKWLKIAKDALTYVYSLTESNEIQTILREIGDAKQYCRVEVQDT